MRRCGPVPYVDLPGPAHVRHRPVLPRSPAERSRRPLRPARPSAPVLPLVEPVPVGPCALPNAPASPLTSQPRRLLLVRRPPDDVVRHRPPPSSSIPPADRVGRRRPSRPPSRRCTSRCHRRPQTRPPPEATTWLRHRLGRAAGARLRCLAEPVLTGPRTSPADDDPVAGASTRATPRAKQSSVLAQGGCGFAQIDPGACGRSYARTPTGRRTRRDGKVRGRPQAASRSRMSSAPSSPPPSPSASKTEPKSSALRALSAITFSSIVSLATIR